MKVWVLLVVAGSIAGIYGSYSYWSGLHPIIQEMHLAAADWDLQRMRLESLERKIAAERASGANPEEFIEEQAIVLENLEASYSRLQALYADCMRDDDCRLEQFVLRESIEEFMRDDRGAWIDWFLATARASDADPVQDQKAAASGNSLDKAAVLKLALGIIGVMYLFSIFKVFFSRDPRNMKVAIDMMKAITGFWFGLVTSVLG